MKKIFSVIAGIAITACALAQAPQKMSYQAVIRDNAGQLIVNHLVGMQVSILKNSPSGNAVYTETLTPATNANGLISIEIGNATGFDTINWGSDIYFIKTETDPTGGTTYSITGTSQLLSVPYAIHAKTAENIAGGITETDPLFGASAASGITTTHVTNWETAYGWGNHAGMGYLTSYTETDPLFTVSPANGITSTNITNWETAYSWGNHAGMGYLTSYTETDPVYSSVFQLSSPLNGQLLSYNNVSAKFENWTPNFLTAEVDGSVTNELELPAQTGNSGKFLSTDGSSPLWSTLDKAAIGLGNVENTALSTWTGSTYLANLGTISVGTWQGTAISETYIGNLSALKITSGVFDNARINWAAPGTIGSTTRNTGAFTSLAANNGLTVSAGLINLKPSGSGGTSGQVLTTDGSGNATWQAVTVSRPTRIITSNTSLNNTDDLVIVRGASVFATLPTSPVNGQTLTICGYEATSGIIIPASQKIRVSCADYTGTYTFNDLKNLFIIVYDSATSTWYMSI